MSANQKGQQPHDEAAGGTADELGDGWQHHVVEVLTTVAVANRGEVEARRRVEPAVDLPDTVGPECEVARALELHGPLGGARGEAGPQPPLVDRVIAVHVVSDLDEVSDEVCRDFVHKSLSAFNRGRSRTNAVYAAAFYACATPLVVLLCAATVAVALAVLRLIPLYR